MYSLAAILGAPKHKAKKPLLDSVSKDIGHLCYRIYHHFRALRANFSHRCLPLWATRGNQASHIPNEEKCSGSETQPTKSIRTATSRVGQALWGPPMPGGEASLKVFVMEDNPTAQKAVRQQLTSKGCTRTSAKNREEVISAVSQLRLLIPTGTCHDVD